MSKQKTDPDLIFLLVSFHTGICLVFFQDFLEMHIQIGYDSTVFSRIVDGQIILQSDGDPMILLSFSCVHSWLIMLKLFQKVTELLWPKLRSKVFLLLLLKSKYFVFNLKTSYQFVTFMILWSCKTAGWTLSTSVALEEALNCSFIVFFCIHLNPYVVTYPCRIHNSIYPVFISLLLRRSHYQQALRDFTSIL